MSDKNKIKMYSAPEERFNIYSHALGFVLSVIATILLTIKALGSSESQLLWGFLVFGFSLCILYAASTIYHSAKDLKKRARLRVFDHASIYVLIAGTYTPFCLCTLSSTIGMAILIAVWSFAIIGVVIKVFYTGKFDIISTVAYVLMGWVIVFAWSPLNDQLDQAGIFWLIAGGVSYSLGAILYSIQKLPYNHAVFHVFVLIGSGCHFISVYYYIVSCS